MALTGVKRLRKLLKPIRRSMSILGVCIVGGGGGVLHTEGAVSLLAPWIQAN